MVFYIDFWSSFDPNFDPLDLKKHCFSLGKTMIFKNSPLEVNIDFRSDFDANLCPCWPPKSKIFQNFKILRRLKIFIDFGTDFLSILGPSWPPTWGHLGSQDASKSEKIVSKLFPAVTAGAFLKRMPLQYRFWSVLAPLLEAKMAPKHRFLGDQGLFFENF